MGLRRWIRRRRQKGTAYPRGNPDDPVWRKIIEMQEVRKAAMRKAMETGEPYRDPYYEAWQRELRDRKA